MISYCRKKIQNIEDEKEIKKLKGRVYPYCFKDIYSEMKAKNSEGNIIEKNQVHTRSLHAEEYVNMEELD